MVQLMTKRAIERWKRLTATGSGDGIVEVPSIDSGIATGFGTARYAIGAQGQPRLLVPIGGHATASELTSTSKLLVTTSSYKVSNKGTLFIDIMCLDRGLDLVFAELAEDILRRIKEGFSPIKAVIASIDDFRELLREKASEEILESKILGLVGELEMMRRLVTLNQTAAETWTGPFELRHDFRQGIHALEVKTSGRSDTTRVFIHGIDQLDPPVGGTLHLAHVRLERAENGQLSIGSVFDSLLKSGADRKTLEKGLEALGCLNPYGKEWNRLSFCLEGIKIYSVSEGFPRITGSSFADGLLPAGVLALEYQIDLNHAKDFELPTDNYKIALERIAG
ncbi:MULTISPECIES: PD-(D/E)XK motif protein [unclassified Pseudomonas]|uniref:PD-(D/E)XK motif protein n=1 Tax=unclassified Pseudomonas TaxID=196821 RepID=UPI00215BC2AA|nr:MULTISPECIES: PD-(D/E)XK motif protein [unclassified Pseudomonas]MCR8935234.1 PD-(D/E)XK motif protein [Pseudomonas sp. S11A4]MCR8973497.1 PD-(D/E)XK motif protein [Pseudomonas sp. S11P7]